jgi:hypothetical protein
MKTTIDRSDSLLEQAKRAAARHSTTVKALVESGPRKELLLRSEESKLELRDASFRGLGLLPQARDLSWEAIRELAYG